MARGRRGSVGKHAAVVSRRKRRTAAIAASALVTLPAALFGNVAGGWVSPAAASVPAPASPHASNPAALGATGALGHDAKLSPDVLHDAGDPIALTTDTGPLANLPSGPLGIPGIVLSAYQKAAQQLAFSDPSCRLPWWLLAGIGKVESNQAENGQVDTSGNTLRPIYGPVLDGNGFAAIPDTDGGTLDGDTTWDRAVGPMQFLPSTWREYGGTGSPSNVFDAALAAGRYLCASGGDLSDPAQQAVAVFNYNHSDSYVRLVLIWADAYEQGVTPLPETLVSTLSDETRNTPSGGATGSTTTVTQATQNGTTTTVTTTTSPTGTTTTTTTTTAPGGKTTTTTTTTHPTTTTTTAPPTTTCTTAPTTTTGTTTSTSAGSTTTTAPTTSTTAPTSTTTTAPTPTC